jgi:hypothetical protein
MHGTKAPFLEEPYKGSDAYITKMQAMVSTFNGSALKIKTMAAAGAATLAAPPAQAATVKEIFEKYKLIGTFSYDCTKPDGQEEFLLCGASNRRQSRAARPNDYERPEHARFRCRDRPG